MAQPDTSAGSARVLVFISGTGSNLQALIDACNTPELPNARIVKVISDRKGVRGLERAELAGIPTTHHGVIPYKQRHPAHSPSHTTIEAREAYDADLAKIVLDAQPDIVVCAGFMRILTPAFLTPLTQASIPIINLHPALHGDLVGANCIERAWEEYQAGNREKSGIMIHYVIVDVDKGEPIVQEEVSMVGCNTMDEYAQRVHEHEHPLIVKGTKMALERVRSQHNP